ncbi:adenylosuccinate lyase [Fructobacillus sp. M1-13]|uniref:Adenylosuccinate lyase n=1 Tax=Fructobacillus papyriferae TaxID=2713171 RepID=A0ABS5QPF4_9LACO|nr:adenylosuccinate lyase [Fructobacillus papyriferae]MBS9334682.1 adenylosuccinate lyase [Fructobacillus papyriferae]MCD2158672.1 adenylosuccinate lyase [Fructobacillus papyriferae]
MLERYARPAMADIWSLENQYNTWLEVEIAIDQAWAEQGLIPADDLKAIQKNAGFDLKRIDEIESQTQHDVVAFTRAVSETLGDEKKWIHYGVTSTDVVDTANGVRLKQANKLISSDLKELQKLLKSQAIQYKDTVMIGRTHGVHAEPTSWGFKLARWYDEIRRHIERFERVAAAVEVGQVSGAVGTFANISPEVEESVCASLGLNNQPITSQVLPRDLYADYLSIIALIGSSLESFATEIRSLQRTEIREVQEFFDKKQKGSSAMPHKRNPIGCENISGLARVLRGYLVPAYEDITLWHERDISHSSVERIVLPDATTLLDYLLTRFTKILQTLEVYPDRMAENVNKTGGLIYSQRVLLMLIDAGLSREKAYDLVQPLTKKAWDEGLSFEQLVKESPKIKELLSPDHLADAFDYHYHLRRINEVFTRLGIH